MLARAFLAHALAAHAGAFHQQEKLVGELFGLGGAGVGAERDQPVTLTAFEVLDHLRAG